MRSSDWSSDVCSSDLLREENIEDIDVFCAVTNDDEANILSAMLAKRLGARKALCLINRLSYVELVEGGSIDVAISPQQSTVSALLSRVRRGDVVRVHRSEEHTSELQSLMRISYAVFCLKKHKKQMIHH